MLSEIELADGISIKACRGDMGVEAPIYRARFGKTQTFELAEGTFKIPLDITGFNFKPNDWLALHLVEPPYLFIAAGGDKLAVKRTRQPRKGQLVVLKHGEHIVIKRFFPVGNGLVLSALDTDADVLVTPAGVDIRGTIEGLAIEGCWYKILTSNRLPER